MAQSLGRQALQQHPWLGKLINLLVFQLGWFVCVIGGNLPALLFTAAALALHHHCIVRSPREWLMVVAVSLVGLSWDALLAGAGLVYFSDPIVAGLPLWLVCLWLLFATTLGHGLGWLQGHLVAAALAAALVAPLSYYGGTLLNSSHLAEPLLLPLAVMALGWAGLFPAALLLARRTLYGA